MTLQTIGQKTESVASMQYSGVPRAMLKETFHELALCPVFYLQR